MRTPSLLLVAFVTLAACRPSGSDSDRPLTFGYVNAFTAVSGTAGVPYPSGARFFTDDTALERHENILLLDDGECRPREDFAVVEDVHWYPAMTIDLIGETETVILARSGLNPGYSSSFEDTRIPPSSRWTVAIHGTSGTTTTFEDSLTVPAALTVLEPVEPTFFPPPSTFDVFTVRWEPIDADEYHVVLFGEGSDVSCRTRDTEIVVPQELADRFETTGTLFVFAVVRNTVVFEDRLIQLAGFALVEKYWAP